MLRVPPSLSSLLPGTLQVPLQINGQTLELGNSATFTGATNQILATSAQIVYNVVAAQKHNFAVGGSGKAEISATGLFLSGSGELLNLGASGPLGSSISSSYNTISGRSTGLEITSGTGLPIKFFVYTNEYERINSGGLHEAYQLSLGGTIGSGVDPGRGGISLTNRLQFSGAGTVDSTKTLIHADAADGNMRIQAPVAKSVVIWIGTGQAFALDNGGIYPGKGIIFSNSAGVANSAQTQIYPDAANGNLLINVPVTKSFGFYVAGIQRFYSDSSGFVSLGRIYANENLSFNGPGTITSIQTSMWADAAAGNLFANVPAAKYEQHQVAGAGLLSLGRYQTTQGNKYWALGAWSANGAAVSSDSGIFSANGSIYSNVPTGSTYDFYWNGINKAKIGASLTEMDRMSLGGTIGSSADPQAGGLALTGLIQFQGSATGLASSVKTQIYADGNAGNLIINTPIAKSLQLLVAGYERMRVDENGVNLNSTGAALTTTATAGHPRIPSCAGAPTGVPSGIMAGTVPICIDSTNSKLYAYIGGAWKSVTLA